MTMAEVRMLIYLEDFVVRTYDQTVVVGRVLSQATDSERVCENVRRKTEKRYR